MENTNNDFFGDSISVHLAKKWRTGQHAEVYHELLNHSPAVIAPLAIDIYKELLTSDFMSTNNNGKQEYNHSEEFRSYCANLGVVRLNQI